jgi:YVTN family beta-propeller protein
MRSPHLPRMLSGRARRRRGTVSRIMSVALVAALSTMGLVLSGTTASAATFQATQKNIAFNPASLSIAVGDTVTWTNDETDGTTHSVVDSADGINSPDMPPGSTFSFTFGSAGTYNITCRFHPAMFQTITVGSSTPPTTTTTAPPTTTTTTAPPTTTTTVPPTTTTTTTTVPPTTTTGTQTGTTPPATSNTNPGGLPIGVGPVPISYQLTDDNGHWFDSHLNLFGNQSLTVAELPRVNVANLSSILGQLNLGNLPLIGNGALSGNDLISAVNGNLSKLVNLAPTSGLNLGGLGVDLSQLLGMDKLKTAIGQALPFGDPRIAQANGIIDRFDQAIAGLPANQPVSLSSLPVGVDLQGLLKDLQAWTSHDITLPVTANFNIAAPATQGSHTVTSLIWPDGAKGFPFDEGGAFVGTTSVQLTQPGLYAFACKIHPYMLSAIVVDDPLTPGLDFGQKLHINERGLDVPSTADQVFQLVEKFFNITTPTNWQHFSDTQPQTWDPQFPPAPILTYDGNGVPQLIPDLDLYLKQKFNTPRTLPALTQRPATPGVGEVWVDTEMEKTKSKDKPGTATKVDVTNWSIARKVALPSVDMNNPHNMWTDPDEQYIYQTEWFNDKLDVFDRNTGAFVRQITVGPDPSHVMTRTDTGQVEVALNAGGAMMELSPGATKIDRRIPTQGPDEKIAHPHAFWISGDGKILLTPNVNLYNATTIDVPGGTFRHDHTGELPIATGFTPDGKKAYQADFLSGQVSCISITSATATDCVNDDGTKVHSKEIDLWANYDPIKGPSGDWGGLSIQIPVSPDGSSVLVANTLTNNITVIDPKTDKVVKYLPCDSGCHGINFGAKLGGGYYGYVSSKFSNAMEVVNIDPNPANDAVVGKFTLDETASTATDDPTVAFNGYGGMGVLPIPIAYEGWVEKAPSNAVNDQLTCQQRHPVTFATDCK